MHRYLHPWLVGSHLEEETASGIGPEQFRNLHINELELCAVHLVMTFFSDPLRGQRVWLYCDNATAVVYLKRGRGAHSSNISMLTEQILQLCDALSVVLLPVHLPGARNVRTDTLSRRGHVTTRRMGTPVCTIAGDLQRVGHASVGSLRDICQCQASGLLRLPVSRPMGLVCGRDVFSFGQVRTGLHLPTGPTTAQGYSEDRNQPRFDLHPYSPDQPVRLWSQSSRS